jgi:hypothetical protein
MTRALVNFLNWLREAKELFLNSQKVFGFSEIPVCLNNNPCHFSEDWFVKLFELQ